jgi:serine/threonine-protein kinase
MQVGRYQILEIIGAGAFSRVVRAFDPLIGRHVAVKLFSPDLARGDARERFVREARVAGQLSHPFIVTVHDMGIDDSTLTPYLVMEVIDGQPLDKLIAKGALPGARACAIAAHVATALHVAHRRGVIHGDVKPANILLTADGRVKITDFGMARLARQDSRKTPLLGTPAYWCPEQIRGGLQDARSDLFSLGVVIYEMVTGRQPFESDSLQGVCNLVLSSAPLAVCRANPSLPAELDAVLAKCLAKDPAERYGSGKALAEALFPLAREAQAAPVITGNSKPRRPALYQRAVRLLRPA